MLETYDLKYFIGNSRYQSDILKWISSADLSPKPICYRVSGEVTDQSKT